MRVRTKDLKAVVLIILLILFSGTLIYKVHNDEFLLLTLAYSMWSIVKKRGHFAADYKKALKYCGVLFASCLVTVYVTHGSLSIGAGLNVVLHFLFTFCVIKDVGGGKAFIKKYCAIVYWIAIISLVLFTIQLISPSLLQRLFIQENYSGTVFYTIGFYTMTRNQITRNCGIMTEPGLYQILLNTALFFYLFFGEGISERKKKNGIIVFSLTVITSQSAVGIVNLALLIFCYLISTEKNSRGKHSNAKILLAGFGLAVMMVITFVPNIPIVSDITSKLFVDGQLNVSGGTGRYRMISMMTDLEVFKRNLFGAGYDNYYGLFSLYKTERVVINSSSCGLTYCLAVFGIATYIIIMGYYLRGVVKSKSNFIVRISLLGVFLFTSWTQPLIYYPPFIAAVWMLIHDGEEENTAREQKVIANETAYQPVYR